mmetsp:Transcript_476/g.517  ORF Transcript_476/g.517 Transcript_476/m.517 type:complete len:453 (-) Transcript_476:75-1433(-)|eukprot:CAMPEP_0205809118 /NCGR_PEP_ID=MMETSP0205-20121125/13234_1 /ASSEMBLY_ACC=CAM_ASM_000278 /TAXON_ID=36767 /ORGANISM="Euplotes focardii, Strain TN1" /LENGTH=452 /DNA_ID=CAMNT_0053085801 /DNA_START=211 /DNA_END=1569 /DNA_ORIENTATION=+
MKRKLGHNWVKLLYQAIETTSQVSIADSESDQGSEDIYSEETEDFVSNHCCNIAIEYYLIAAKKKDKEDSFDDFHNGIKEYFKNKGYNVVDEHLFESLAHTFHILAEGEEDNISNKKKIDEKFDLEYRLNKKKRDLKMESKEEGSLEEEKDSQVDPNLIAKSRHRRYNTMIPRFIKKRIITPLLIASEKVVEYIIPEQPVNGDKKKKTEEGIEEEKDEENNLNNKMSNLTLEEAERQNKRRTIKTLKKSKNIHISKNLINKASDCVDFISERMPVESKVTRNFVTNMIELSDSALKRISASCKGIDESENINMRFIKPSKKFYNLLMSVWIKMDTRSIFDLTEDEFNNHVKQSLEKESIPWSDAYIEPTKTFYNVAHEEFMNLYQNQKDNTSDHEVEPSNFIFSVSRFFTSIKTTLLEMWHSEIVNKSATFTSAATDDEVNETSKEEKKEEA